LVSDCVGELATKSKVPYEVIVDRTMTATVQQQGEAVEVHLTGLFFAAPEDALPLLEEALGYKDTVLANGDCKKKCGSLDDVKGQLSCESCVAYKWYVQKFMPDMKDMKKEGSVTGKMARILEATPIQNYALSLEVQQGDRLPSKVGNNNRERILYSMLLAQPTRFDKVIFGNSPADFNAPLETMNAKNKMAPTYSKAGPYMAAVPVADFHGNTVLETFFQEHNLLAKSIEIAKATLIGKLGTTYDYPLDTAESLGQGTSGINFARLVSAANPLLQSQKIYVRPAKPDKVMKMLGLCHAALENAEKIETGCGGSDGRILWRKK